MREILFRGKSTDGEWVEGYYIKGKYYLNGKEINAIAPLDLAFFPHCELSEYIDVLPETVGQYTGLTDKNGKKIFEGDIVDIQYPDTFVCNTVISYIGASFYGDDGNDCWNLDDYTSLEVVGNIHDNPELLKENV